MSLPEMVTGRMDDNRRKSSPPQSRLRSWLEILLIVVATHLLTTLLFISRTSILDWTEYAKKVPRFDTDSLLQELNSTQFMLTATQQQLHLLSSQLQTANFLLQRLPSELRNPQESAEDWISDLSDELKSAVHAHQLPLGRNSNFGSDKLYPVLGSACKHHLSDLEQYMKYQVGGQCPSDDVFAQRLMLKGCEPLPRRRCHPKTPDNYEEPRRLPDALWAIPPDNSIVWDPYTCKNYSCLVNRGNTPGFFDCNDCFHLSGREKSRWMFDNGYLDYSIDRVLAAKPEGTIRIGLDLGGGSGTFAARMKERGVTIVTTSMNFNGPFNSFIASRGLIPMHISISHRLPFFDNTLDIIHSMHVISNWIPDAMLEFALFDIYRVLRPGGLFWLDHFFCLGTQLNYTYVPLIGKVGFKRLRWNTGRKIDRGAHKNERYLSALLEKPTS